MSKPPRRWSIWKVAGSTMLCFMIAGVLFCLSYYMHRLGGETTTQPEAEGVLTFPGFVMVLGLGVSMLGIICCIWLGFRIKEARTPPWERKGRSKRR
jgi:hypothetical protein